MGHADRLLLGAERRLQRLPRWLAAHRPRAVEVARQPVTLTSGAGYRIAGCVHSPVGGSDRRRPAVLLCPGIDDPGSVFVGQAAPISADEVARLGVHCMRFDPAGRGESWGVEDFGGPEHQDEVATALRYLVSRPDVVASRSGVVAISLGIAMAVGALAQAGEGCRLGWLIDWEGPCDREIITAGGRILAPAAGHGLDDDAWWRPREAVRNLAGIRCGYFRYQASRDHAQPGELRHAQRMMRAASEAGLPWFQLNDHPRNTVPDRPKWYPPGHGFANRTIMAKIALFAAL
ncbi:MAG: hypothetical protein ABIO70_27210 [Pseudomonadota bacterium]